MNNSRCAITVRDAAVTRT